jgi:hypothetical protein
MGVEPMNATDHSDITRPRMAGSEDSCRVVLPSDKNVTDPAPTNNRATFSLHEFGATAANPIATPKNRAAQVRAEDLVERRDAAMRPPTTAPIPTHAVSTP